MQFAETISTLATTGAEGFIPWVIGAVVLMLVGAVVMFLVRRRQAAAERAREGASGAAASPGEPLDS